MLQEVLNNSRKVVLKIGSNTLSREDGTLNRDFFKDLSSQINILKTRGCQVVIVSSGARIAGVSTLGKWKRKEDLHYKQALCSIGQVELMDSYRKELKEFGFVIGQILLTKDDFSDPNRTLNIRNTLFTLLDEGVIPIINENDSVSVDEIKIGDNDNLAALTANLWNADLLLIMSDIDGVYNKDPGEYADAQLIEVIEEAEALSQKIEIGSKGDFGTGGILTKIEAACKVNEYGIPMILANGKRKNLIPGLLEGKYPGTIFVP
ncbi:MULTISPECIES: glutamate 5-kinase [unclassified Oceanispirochaeta]|uniref:glutamate 5-kinase n=1 Tax=unclassified Oceanispirochaeta TaxID=2635722 RepID=UPI000E09882E|nr:MULTISPECIES: glutamate 5-kinase [unclassified Oceanispirochaeta]MBF9015567.1 glutamate 5-kinase [Oceanispirochaeta sp. M2]NPD73944.1 glutamate 5-kinase [Oceanispirochaeta sp. M1]RDG30255.1 glutamate 5-kinase [Oceanispirochaeta sp. M1]